MKTTAVIGLALAVAVVVPAAGAARAQTVPARPATSLGDVANAAAPAIYHVVMTDSGRACGGTAFAIHSYRRIGTFFVTARHVLSCLGLADTPLLRDTHLLPPWGGRALPVKTVALSATEDLAVIETPYLPRTRVAPLAFAPGAAQVGDTVLALGYGSVDGQGDDVSADPTWTSGSVDWIADEPIDGSWTVSEAVVHEATTYPGYSGGPLLDVAGQVVGVNDAYTLGGYSIAIPAGTARGETAALILTILDAAG
jgi:S1-C subfamily serine protease